MPCVETAGASIIEKKIPAALAARTAEEMGDAMLEIDITILMIEVRTLMKLLIGV